MEYTCGLCGTHVWCNRVGDRGLYKDIVINGTHYPSIEAAHSAVDMWVGIEATRLRIQKAICPFCPTNDLKQYARNKRRKSRPGNTMFLKFAKLPAYGKANVSQDRFTRLNSGRE